MNKKLIAWSAVLLIFLLAMNIILIVNYKQEKNQPPAGQASKAAPVSTADEVSIDKKDMKACCTFQHDGKEQTCYVLERFSCDYCTSTCRA